MSPTEKELRAFLREGEGDVPDAVSVMSNAMRVREARRKRLTTVLTSAAAAVIVIGGSVLLVNAGGSNEKAGSANDAGGLAQTSITNGPAAGSARSGPNDEKHQSMSRASVVAPNAKGSDQYSARMGLPMCASSPTHYALPGGGGLNSFGANGKMWKRTPNAMRVCAYIGSGRPASRMIYGPQAAAIAQSVETASVTSIAGTSCPRAIPSATGGTIEIYALDSHQNKLKAVVFDVPACGAVHATNGTASRYLAKLPSGLANTLAKAENRASPHR